MRETLREYGPAIAPPGVMLALVALPWLQGFQPQAVADHPSRAVAEELSEYRPTDEDCVASAYGGLSLDTGNGRVLASFSQGVFVLDENRQLVAQAPGFDCNGSADELVALAQGDAWIGSPVVALAATTGGRAESVTWLSLYKVSEGGALEPVFTGTVERHEGRQTRTGVVTVIPGGLIYRAPEGTTSVWIWDGKRYVEQGKTLA
jgi:hypothetical protein